MPNYYNKYVTCWIFNKPGYDYWTGPNPDKYPEALQDAYDRAKLLTSSGLRAIPICVTEIILDENGEPYVPATGGIMKDEMWQCEVCGMETPVVREKSNLPSCIRNCHECQKFTIHGRLRR